MNYPQTKDWWASDFIVDNLRVGMTSAPSVESTVPADIFRKPSLRILIVAFKSLSITLLENILKIKVRAIHPTH